MPGRILRPRATGSISTIAARCCAHALRTRFRKNKGLATKYYARYDASLELEMRAFVANLQADAAKALCRATSS